MNIDRSLSAEDGVRLGCYGHELHGKKYSTHYVADANGYRLVPHQGFITVYPKDGSEARKASFVQSFNEDEIRSVNIRYFFPDGCSSMKTELGALVFAPKVEVKEEVIEVPADEITTVLPDDEEPESLEGEEQTICSQPSPVISIKIEITLPTNVLNSEPFTPYKSDEIKCPDSCSEKNFTRIIIPVEKQMLEETIEKLLELVKQSKL